MRLGRLTLIVVVGCGGGAVKQVAAPRGATCDISASWAGTAVDPSGVEWQVLLVLHQETTNVAGTAEWTSGPGARFVEDVQGVVDCPTGVVTLRTPNFVADDATAMVASYRFELSADDRAIKGSWDNGSGTPGTLAASRK